VPGPIDETQETYAAIAPEYARRTGDLDPQLLDDADVFTRHLPPGSVVADVGCGPGRDMELLRSHGLRVFGFDMSAAQLRAGGLPGLVRADMRALPLRDGSVNAIWCRAALLHIPRAEVVTVLHGFAAAIADGGRLYLAVAEGDGEGWEVAVNYNSDRRRWFTYHREPEMRALLATAGFEVDRVVRTSAYRDWMSIQASRRPNPSAA
jgi:SAM-dependent methyltransferase